MTMVTSWGRVAWADEELREPAFLDDVPGLLEPSRPSLAYGMGRSYGDVCLNDGGRLIRTTRLDRIIAADWHNGVVRAEAGLTLDALLRLSVPRGWFPPVVPGTKFVTLGGAVANDVHGKNHESAGTFGCHVRAIGLQRSSGDTIEIGPGRNPELFAATVGGLGLTGLMLWVELQLIRAPSAFFLQETVRLRDLDHFFEVAATSREWPYTVAWVDCLATGAGLGRGLFSRARPAPGAPLEPHRERGALRIPIDAPSFLMSSAAVRAFNLAYARRPNAVGASTVHYDPFLFPLDRIHDWNRLYGKRGFFQHQSVVPMENAPSAIKELLALSSGHRQGSFLVVLKLFGSRASPGLLSFPMEGATFALDLPNRGEETRGLLARMAGVVRDAGGRIYPAKDAVLSGEDFRSAYPRWREVEAHRDPALMSDFWRRVTRDAW
jgi:L-gulonolactone oxidase